MQPALLVVFNKVRQEARRRAGARRVGGVSGIIQFCEVRRQLVTVEFRQRQTPERLIFRTGTRQQAVCQGIVKAEQCVIIVAERGFRSTGQRGGINQQFRFLGAGINQTICQHQTAFRVSIHDFHSFAVAVANDIAQFEGVAADHVVGAAQVQLDAFIQAAGNGERQRASNQRRATHIGFHRIHKGALLKAVTTGIKGDAFAHQAGVDRGIRIAGGIVIQRQQYRSAIRSATNGVDPHVVLLTQIFAFGDAVFHAVAGDAAQQIHCALGQLFRAQLFRRRVNGVAYPVDDFQAAIQLFLLLFVERRPLDFTAAFRSFITLPEGPAAVRVPAFARERDVLNTQPVDFTGGALDQAQVVFVIQVQGDAVIINTVCRFFSPAGVGRLG